MSELVYLINCHYTSLVGPVSRDTIFTFRMMCSLWQSRHSNYSDYQPHYLYVTLQKKGPLWKANGRSDTQKTFYTNICDIPPWCTAVLSASILQYLMMSFNQSQSTSHYTKNALQRCSCDWLTLLQLSKFFAVHRTQVSHRSPSQVPLMYPRSPFHIPTH